MNLLEKIYNNISHEKIWGPDGLTPLNNFKANSGGYIACCPNPAHPDKKPSFLMKEGIPAGKCQSCGYYLSWFKATAISLGYENQIVKGKDYWKVINTLTKLNGGMIFEFTTEEKEQYELQHEIQELKNILSIYLHRQLLENVWAEDTCKYLEKRGVPRKYFSRFPMLGFYPQTESVEQFLISEGFSFEAIQESNALQKCFQNCCLIFSYKDELGNTLGFKGRKPSLKIKDIKYQKGFKGEIKDRAIMGLECCNIAIKDGERAVCQEGEFDWLTSQVETLKLYDKTAEFVCFGGSDVKPGKIETLKKSGAKVLYLSFDPDTAGKKATREAIKYAEKIGLCSLIVRLPSGNDPDEYIRSYGFSDYQKCIKNACKSSEWLAREFLNKYTLDSTEGMEKAKIALCEEAKNYKGLTLESFVDLATRPLNVDKNYVLNLIEKQYYQEIKGVEPLPLKSFLPNIPAQEDFMTPTGWILNSGNLIKLSQTKEGPKEIIVAPAPFYVSSRSENIDTRQEKLELTYLRNKKWKTEYQERAILMDHRKIVNLSGMGFPVDSLNCKDIVNFIHSFEALNDEKLPKQTTISGFGWKKEKGAPFFVMPDKAYGTDLSIVFEPEGLGDERLAKALRAEGTLENWLRAINLCVKYPRVMFHIYASFTAPLLELLDAPNFIIDNWGLTSTGKTSVLEITASVWGLPVKEKSGLILPWDATKVSIERVACTFNHLPILLDDSHTANEKIQAKAIYMIGNGMGRIRGAIKGMQKTSNWRTVAFSTGERQLSEITEYEGAKARIIELYGSPFETNKQSELIYKIKADIHSNYGLAGPLFINDIINSGYHESPKILREEYREITSELARLGKDNVSDRMAQYLAAVQVAGRLAEKLFKFGGNPEKIVRNIFTSACGESRQKGNYPERALEHIISWVQGNQNNFDRQDQLATVEKGEVFGVIREGEYIGIFPHKFKEIIKKSEFDFSSVIKIFKDRNWIQTEKEHNQCKIGFRSKMVRMIKFQWDAFRDLWD